MKQKKLSAEKERFFTQAGQPISHSYGHVQRMAPHVRRAAHVRRARSVSRPLAPRAHSLPTPGVAQRKCTLSGFRGPVMHYLIRLTFLVLVFKDKNLRAA